MPPFISHSLAFFSYTHLFFIICIVPFRSSRFESDVQVRPLSGGSLSEQRHMCEWCDRLLPLHLPFQLQGERTANGPHTSCPPAHVFRIYRIFLWVMCIITCKRASSSIFPSSSYCIWISWLVPIVPGQRLWGDVCVDSFSAGTVWPWGWSWQMHCKRCKECGLLFKSNLFRDKKLWEMISGAYRNANFMASSSSLPWVKTDKHTWT